MLLAGIDPGQKGGVAILEAGQDGAIRLLDARPMPIAGEKEIDIEGLWRILEHVDLVGLEHAQAFPKQGIVSTGRYMAQWGEIIGFLKAAAIPYALVRPTVWKEATYTWAFRRFPNALGLMRPGRSKKFHDGVADAIAIAYWAHLDNRENPFGVAGGSEHDRSDLRETAANAQ